VVHGMEFTNEAGEVTLVPFASILFIVRRKTQGTMYFPKVEDHGKDALFVKTNAYEGLGFWVTDKSMIEQLWKAYGEWMDRGPKWPNPFGNLPGGR